jgi:outer membrane protein assembly factor BamB
MRIVAIATGLLAWATAAVAGDWYRWRGPEQNGVCRETGLPESFTPGEELWKAPAGGMASPIVLGGRVYLITRIGEEKAPGTLVAGPHTQEALVCLDANTGRPVWELRKNIFQTTVPFHRLGWSNPCGDSETGNVYWLGVEGTFSCVDGKTGQIVWQHQIFEEFGYISTFGGRTQTPAVDEDQVFIGGVYFGWADHARGQARLLAFDKRTGRLNWSSNTGGIPNTVSFNTPVFTIVNGVRQVVWGAGDGGVYGFKARTGEKLWGTILSKLGINASVVCDGPRVYAVHSEENIDTNIMGRVVCWDIGGGGPEPKTVWKVDGVEAGFATPILHEGRLYVVDNGGKLYAFDAKDGAKHWERKLGTMGRSSPIWADGKIYVGEGNGRFYILRPGPTKCDILARIDVSGKLGREYDIYGSPAISDGRLFLPCANTVYCIGPKVPAATPTLPPSPANEGPAEPTPAVIQVVPADVTLRPGQSVTLTARAFDARGRLIGTAQAGGWALDQLTVVAKTGAARKVGNLKGKVDASGTYAAEAGGPQAGAVTCQVGNLTGRARVRVLPPLPWKMDFETAPEGAPPATWINVGGKFAVGTMDGGKVLVKLTDFALYQNARAFFGVPAMTGYTVECEFKTDSKVLGDARQMPDAGVINSRYCLALLGNHQKLTVYTWPSEVPHSLNRTIPYTWEAGVWYHVKLRVDQADNKALVRGKVWKRGQPEPAAWTVELEDSLPNRAGSPGLFAFSNQDIPIYYDNIQVSENKP